MGVSSELLVLCALSLGATGGASLFHPLYVISVGYGLAVAALGVGGLVLFPGNLNLGNALHAAGMLLYGVRLALFVARRQGHPSFQDKRKEIDERTKGMGDIGKLAPMVVSCALLYVAMFSPAYCTLQQPGYVPSLTVGLPLMYTGLVIEAVADEQKQAAKKKTKHGFVKEGLFSLVQHPNYMGELLFWTGSWIAGLSAYHTWQHWAGSVLGLVSIWGIMLQATKSLAKKQEAKYANAPGWKEYHSKTGMLLPNLLRL